MRRKFRPMAFLSALLVLTAPPLTAEEKPFMGGFPIVVTAPVGSCSGVFNDVGNGNPFCPWIEQSYANQILAACDTTPLRFCAKDSVTREQLAKAAEQTLALAQTQAGSWGISGNAGTTAGANFIGTTDDTSFEIHVNGERALRIAPKTTASFGLNSNLIAGSSSNFISAGSGGAVVAGVTIGGGGHEFGPNRAHDHFAVVAGGADNSAGAADDDPDTGSFAVVSGGWQNHATAFASVVGGGFNTVASAVESTVAGGAANVASGGFSFVAGGLDNHASGARSFAGGNRAKANGDGAFVWADNSGFDFSAAADNVFKVRATGGVKFVTGIDGSGDPTTLCEIAGGGMSWSCSSDRNLKDLAPRADGREILDKLVTLPIYPWSAKGDEKRTPHLGPTAQDFHAAFGLGTDDPQVAGIDLDGVSLAAIQGLNRKLEATIAAQQRQIDALRDRLEAMERERASAKTENGRTTR